MKLQKNSILVIIVLCQFLGTSLWFAGNGVMAHLIDSFSLNLAAVGHLTSAVQFGFISGTLVFALLTLADRYSPSKVFFVSACLGAAFNLGVIHSQNTFFTLFFFRFATGFFLAGIYPVGMKIAADYFKEGLGKSLGFLVGALVVGTALPHLLNSLMTDLPWRAVIIVTSVLSVTGGLFIYILVPDGPHRTPGKKPDFSAWFRVFKDRDFRSAAFGYFGHMWELYAFWAFVPLMIAGYFDTQGLAAGNISILSFIIIGLGGVSCAVGGILSGKLGTKRTAFVALFSSCCCCLLYPLFFSQTSGALFIAFLIFWGLVVIADSPLFSTLVAHNAPGEIKGTALTIVNCIGFSITIVSIQTVTWLLPLVNPAYLYMILALGPIAGLYALRFRETFSVSG
ncbi:MFS transporter [Rhodohalobacter mucosus]|uniref:MFS transporter n=1 Tax=Rhodohalobacter mucosus TaxID=2079485 RepID=A0A316TVF1_9BACT|nr:MFS transporter [Rhodohalobacter mucosus]PWN07898.1 MFS transporter [Rhodohalobacter mucosus]